MKLTKINTTKFVGKKYNTDGIKISSSPKAVEGKYEVIDPTFKEFGDVLNNMSNSVLCLGIPDETEGEVVFEYKVGDHSKAIARTKTYFKDGVFWFILDIDASPTIAHIQPSLAPKTEEEVISITKEVIGDVSFYLKPSSSRVATGSNNWHVWVPMSKKAKLSDISKFITLKMQELGLRCVGLDTAGRKLDRNHFCDMSVFSPERIIYEALPKNEDNEDYTAAETTVYDNGKLFDPDTMTTGKLTKVAVTAGEEKVAADRATQYNVDGVARMGESEWTEFKKRAKVGEVELTDPIKDAGGNWIKVQDLVDAGKQVSCYSPFEPDYERSAAVYYPDTHKIFDHHTQQRIKIIDAVSEFDPVQVEGAPTKKPRGVVCYVTYRGGGIRMVFFKRRSGKLIKFGDEESYLMSKDAGFNYLRKNDGFKGLSAKDEKQHLAKIEVVDIVKRAFKPSGFNASKRAYNDIPSNAFDPKENPMKMNSIVRTALSIFDPDPKWRDHPFSLIIIAYQMFHTDYIMPTLAMVGTQGDGKSFYTYEILRWFNGSEMWSSISPNNSASSWGDMKLGRRGVVYNDVGNMQGKQRDTFLETIKNEATEGASTVHNLKGGRVMKAKNGQNRNISSNTAIPLEVEGGLDRRTFVSAYSTEGINIEDMAKAFGQESPTEKQERNRKALVTRLYEIYNDCEANMDDDLRTWMVWKVATSEHKMSMMEGQMADGRSMMNELEQGVDDDHLVEVFEKYCSNVDSVVKFWKDSRVDDDKGKWFMSDDDLTILRRMTVTEEGHVAPDKKVRKADAARAFLGLGKRQFTPQRMKGENKKGMKFLKSRSI